MPHQCTLLLLLILSFSFEKTGAATCYGDGTKTDFGMSCQQILDEHNIPLFCNQPSLQTSCCQSWANYCERKDGVCTGDVGPAVFNDLTCSKVVGTYGKSIFCAHPDKFKVLCCQSWKDLCDQVKCKGSGELIPKEKLCDKQEDCSDGSDENRIACYQCFDGSLISRSNLCNGKAECPDGSDEGHQGTCVMCSDRLRPDYGITCNGTSDCSGGSDEAGCQGGIDVHGNYVIELLIVIDLAAQRQYLLENNNNKLDAKKTMMNELDYFLAEVNKHYANFYGSTLEMKVSKRKVLFVENNDILSPKQQSSNGNGKPRILTRDGSDLFEDYLRKTEAKAKYNYDHAVLFTGFDIGSQETGDYGVAGVANTGRACDSQGEATSLVEWTGDYYTPAVFVHELAHSLGSRHDPSYIKTFIMASATHFEDERWSFSSISRQSISKYIRKLNKLNNNCLLEEGSTKGYDIIVNADIPPTLAYPSTLCLRAFGQGYYYFPNPPEWNGRGSAKGDFLCNKITCTNGNLRKWVPSSDGMACDKHKVCNEGKCKPSAGEVAKNAIDGECLFGDVQKKEYCEKLDKTHLADLCQKDNDVCCSTAAKHCDRGLDACYDDVKGVVYEAEGLSCQGVISRFRKTAFCDQRNNAKFKFERYCCKSWEELCTAKNNWYSWKRLIQTLDRTIQGGRVEKLEPEKKTNEESLRETTPENEVANHDGDFKFEVTSEPLQDITYPIISGTQEILPDIIQILPDLTEKTEIAEDR